MTPSLVLNKIRLIGNKDTLITWVRVDKCVISNFIDNHYTRVDLSVNNMTVSEKEEVNCSDILDI